MDNMDKKKIIQVDIPVVQPCLGSLVQMQQARLVLVELLSLEAMHLAMQSEWMRPSFVVELFEILRGDFETKPKIILFTFNVLRNAS